MALPVRIAEQTPPKTIAVTVNAVGVQRVRNVAAIAINAITSAAAAAFSIATLASGNTALPAARPVCSATAVDVNNVWKRVCVKLVKGNKMNRPKTTWRMKTWKRPRKSRLPTLKFSPSAWAKLLYLRDAGETEIGGFGISAADDLLRIEDVVLVRQNCTMVTVAFDDNAVAEFFDNQVDRSRRPEQFGRVWIHTHPGESPQPSGTDEETFDRVFGSCDWAIMFILARGGASYARLRFNTGPRAELILRVEIDFQRPFGSTAEELWRAEYAACVRTMPLIPMPSQKCRVDSRLADRRTERTEELDFQWLDMWSEHASDHSFERWEPDYAAVD